MNDRYDPRDGILILLLWIAVMLAVLNFAAASETCHLKPSAMPLDNAISEDYR